MGRVLFDRILRVEETFRTDPVYRQLLQEYTLRNDILLQQMETMTPRQQEAVLDYCGILVELQLKMLEFAVQCSN